MRRGHICEVRARAREGGTNRQVDGEQQRVGLRRELVEADTDRDVAADVAVALRAQVERRARRRAVGMGERAKDLSQLGRLRRRRAWVLARGAAGAREGSASAPC